MNPCLLIPIYDHPRTIRGVVESLAPHGLPCLVVDDGSHAETRGVLERIESELARVSVHRRERNGGRGAALKTGYRLAAERGFSHAIQLDAEELLSGREYDVDSYRVLRLAETSGRSAYDCEFVALADHLGVRLATGDQALQRSFPGIAVSLNEAVG